MIYFWWPAQAILVTKMLRIIIPAALIVIGAIVGFIIGNWK